jgi:hypothetical protein
MVKKLIPKLPSDEQKPSEPKAQKKEKQPPTIARVGPCPSDDFPRMDEAAYHGLSGKIVRTIRPHTEADNNAVLLHYLVMVGNSIGRGPYVMIEGAPHFTNLFLVVEGPTSLGRKGTAASRVKELFRLAEPLWTRRCIKGRLSTAEGLIKLLRDPSPDDAMAMAAAGQKPEKRALFLITEFSSLFAVMLRPGNTLADELPNAWDGTPLENLTKKDPMTANDHLVSIIGHVTKAKLTSSLTRLHAGSGFANRFLFARVRRSKRLPHGGNLSKEAIEDMARHTREAIEYARSVGEMPISAAGNAFWDGVYDSLTSLPPMDITDMLARGAPMVKRLALVYALLDQADEIDEVHLRAGYAVWQFCRASTEQLFADALEDPRATKIMDRLQAAGDQGMSRSDINGIFKGREPSADLKEILDYLKSKGRVRSEEKKTAGRTAEYWYTDIWKRGKKG